MFFRREQPKVWTFDERIASLRDAGFDSSPATGGGVIAKRGGYGAVLTDAGEGKVRLGKSGVITGDEVAVLVHGGFQMFFETPSGKQMPALAPQLTALHGFDEDLREALGLTSLYNLSLGTTCEDHLYDRVTGRDAAPKAHPWDKKPAQV